MGGDLAVGDTLAARGAGLSKMPGFRGFGDCLSGARVSRSSGEAADSRFDLATRAGCRSPAGEATLLLLAGSVAWLGLADGRSWEGSAAGGVVGGLFAGSDSSPASVWLAGGLIALCVAAGALGSVVLGGALCSKATEEVRRTGA